MMRFERQPTPLIDFALVVSVAAVFVSDLYTSLGVAVWVFYLLPVVLAFFVWRPYVPAAVAGVATVLTILGYFLSPPGVDLGISQLNRTFGIAMSWALAAIGAQFIRNKIEVRKEEWIQSGQTLLSEKMTGEPNLGALGERVLRFLAEYLGAQGGAIFLDDGGGFRRVATYGVPEGARVPDRVQAGDGLLGQAIVDRRTFTVQDVPDGYLVIGSGLGRSSARHLLIAPFAVDGTVNALLELGFFRRLYQADTELLARLSESVAVAVRSAHYRARQQTLLEETQRQAEELQTQSEELRVANEELEEQSRALVESHARLEQQQVELEQINSQLEEQAQILEAQKEELIGAKHELEAQAHDLELASRYKSEFLANMSHELRTPLNSSLILAKLLADNRGGNLTSEQIQYAKTIEAAGNDLLVLINDVLDLSKVEAGHMEVNPQPVGLHGLIENLRAAFQPVAEQKGLRLHMRIAPDAPDTMDTGPQRLEQVLKNLFSNALKFTEQGEVTLGVGRSPDGRIAFAVSDTGIGIPEHQQQMIFEPFSQADGNTNRGYGGTGLGLSISRELVRLLGGEMRLSSVPGHGSTFTVILPERYDARLVRPRAAESPVTQAASPRFPPAATFDGPSAPAPPRLPDDREHLTGNRRLILIVEDDEHFAKILYDLAQELGFYALIATSADEALALSAQYLPSAVVLDIGLPDHSGLSVLDRLKKDARTRHIPVHVVSAGDYAHRALSLGAAGYILKPVKREELVDAFRLLETRLTQQPRRVLIVEDDPVQLDSLSRLLGSRDVETVGAGSAAGCLEQLRGATFDCMVLDLSLPDASGFSLLETLSLEDRYSFPPVIVYTGRDLAQDEEERLRKYSKSIIIKGAKSPERLLDEVTLFLHQVVSELPLEQRRMLESARNRDALLEGRHILVVEDDVRNVFALASVLEPCGVKIQVARNGRECLDTLTRSLQSGAPPVDLVLMDIMMPEMDGLTATREIRARGEWKHLPIIALTAKAMRNDQEQALAAGANDYMAKPLDVDKLLSLVRVWMPR